MPSHLRPQLSGLLCGVLHKQGKLCAIYQPAPFQIGERLIHQPEFRLSYAVRRHEFLERERAEGYRLEELHPPVTHTRQHPSPPAAEHWHAEAPAIVEREPVAVGASHCI
jgi:hypothetical protein